MISCLFGCLAELCSCSDLDQQQEHRRRLEHRLSFSDRASNRRRKPPSYERSELGFRVRLTGIARPADVPSRSPIGGSSGTAATFGLLIPRTPFWAVYESASVKVAAIPELDRFSFDQDHVARA